ncbi:hypothetical protein [Streptomyces sp. TRM72054]|uniref:hypothetical protein n=1 Tax=Streptomyces sp. TRM72054 TaxID=2870562 RepID=UPI0027E14F44|nr:hypothetical protein [Streptomyces sp. TRM72054]
MITDSSQDGAPAGLPAVAGSVYRVPEPGTVEAEFTGVDGTLVQRRWVEAAVAVRFEQSRRRWRRSRWCRGGGGGRAGGGRPRPGGM